MSNDFARGSWARQDGAELRNADARQRIERLLGITERLNGAIGPESVVTQRLLDVLVEAEIALKRCQARLLADQPKENK